MRRLVIMLSVTVWSVLAAQEPRYLNFEPGKTIASRLKADDRHIVIEKNLPPLLGRIPGDLPAKEILEGYSLHAAAVLVVRLTAKQSVLTNSGDWIVTRFKGKVVEQFKPQPMTLRVEDFILEIDGGSVTIGKTRVDASAYWEPEFVVNRTYLVFPESRTWPALGVVAYEIANGRLKNTSSDFDPDDSVDNLHGVPLSEARKIILAAPPRGRPPL